MPILHHIKPVVRAIEVSHPASKDEFFMKSSIAQLGDIFNVFTHVYVCAALLSIHSSAVLGIIHFALRQFIVRIPVRHESNVLYC